MAKRFILVWYYRLGEKKSVVRSERMEWRMIELHNQRQVSIISCTEELLVTFM